MCKSSGAKASEDFLFGVWDCKAWSPLLHRGNQKSSILLYSTTKPPPSGGLYQRAQATGTPLKGDYIGRFNPPCKVNGFIWEDSLKSESNRLKPYGGWRDSTSSRHIHLVLDGLRAALIRQYMQSDSTRVYQMPEQSIGATASSYGVIGRFDSFFWHYGTVAQWSARPPHKRKVLQVQVLSVPLGRIRKLAKRAISKIVG